MKKKRIVKARLQDVGKLNKSTTKAPKNSTSLKYYAKENGITWQELTKFNWGTSNPKKVNKYLFGQVGCRSKTQDEHNYIFTDIDWASGPEAGLIWIPEEYQGKPFSTDNIHTLNVKLPKKTTYIPSDCIVRFRPGPGWLGEYGFDWMREDKDYPVTNAPNIGDNEFKDIIGTYYTDSTKTTLFADSNAWSSDFDKVVVSLDDLKLKEYLKSTDLPLPSRTYENFASYISVYMKEDDPHVNIDIQAFVRIESEKLDELEFLMDAPDGHDYLSIKSPTKDLKNIPTGYYEIPITIEFKKPLLSQIIINAYAHTKEYDGCRLTTLVGRLVVMANQIFCRKSVKIVIVEVDVGEVSSVGNTPINIANQKTLFKKFMHQALIDPNIATESLNLSGDAAFKGKYIKNNKILGYKDNDASFKIQNELTKRLDKLHGTTYAKHFKVFCFGYPGVKIELTSTGSENPVDLNGYSSGDKVVLFSTGNDSTPCHEIFHSLKLPHTFDTGASTTSKVSKNAKFTYKAQETENIMDYTHSRAGDLHKNSRISLYHWQWVIANNNADSDVIGDFEVLPSNLA